MTEPISAPVAPRNKGGRPPGAKNKPRVTPGPAQAPAPPPPPADAILTGDDRNVSTAERIAAAAVPPSEPKGAGGRPTARDAAINGLALQLAESYNGIGSMLEVFGSLVLGFNPGIGQRMIDVGHEIVRGADKCGLSLARMAENNPALKRWLTKGTGMAGLLAVIAAHAPIGAALIGRADQARTVAMVADMVSDDGASVDVGDILGQAADAMSGMFAQMFMAAGAAPGPTGVPIETTAAETAPA